ncbi:unnamed protein product [Caenorhabditis brenneri]
MWLTPLLFLILFSNATAAQKPSAEIEEAENIVWGVFIRLTNLLRDNKQEEAVKLFSPSFIFDRCDRTYDAKELVHLWTNIEKSKNERIVFDHRWIRKHGLRSKYFIEFGIRFEAGVNWGTMRTLVVRRVDQKIVRGRYICSRITKACSCT